MLEGYSRTLFCWFASKFLLWRNFIISLSISPFLIHFMICPSLQPKNIWHVSMPLSLFLQWALSYFQGVYPILWKYVPFKSSVFQAKQGKLFWSPLVRQAFSFSASVTVCLFWVWMIGIINSSPNRIVWKCFVQWP